MYMDGDAVSVDICVDVYVHLCMTVTGVASEEEEEGGGFIYG